jgi:AcrR family transcriptional regulator
MATRAAGSRRDDAATQARLLRAATELFAERGFHATTVRAIAARAGANVAAGHYHFGSKRDLYVAVLRARFAELGRELERAGTRLSDAELTRLPRAELERLFRARIEVMLRFVLGRSSELHSRLMFREMLDPSESLPLIVDEFLLPIMVREMSAIVRRLAPGLDPETLLRCVASVSGQALFYHVTKPASLRIFQRRGWSPAFLQSLADHICTFSLGGIARLGARAGRRRRAR